MTPSDLPATADAGTQSSEWLLTAETTMGAADGHPLAHMLDERMWTFHLGNRNPQEYDAVTVTLPPSTWLELSSVTVDLGDGFGENLWPDSVLEYSPDKSAWWPLGTYDAGIDRIDVDSASPIAARYVRLRATAAGAVPVAVRRFQVAARSRVPALLTTDPAPLQMSTFAHARFGTVHLSFGRDWGSGAALPTYCRAISVRVPAGRQGWALTLDPAAVRCSASAVEGPDQGTEWEPQELDDRHPEYAVYSFVPRDAAIFDGTWQVDLTLSDIELTGVAQTVFLDIDQVVSPSGRDDDYVTTRSRVAVEKVPGGFYFHSLRPDTAAITAGTKTWLRWEGPGSAQYRMYYRGTNGAETNIAVSDGCWETPTLSESTHFTLKATTGNEDHYLTTYLTVAHSNTAARVVTGSLSPATIASGTSDPLTIDGSMLVRSELSIGSLTSHGPVQVASLTSRGAVQIRDTEALRIKDLVVSRFVEPGDDAIELFGTPQRFSLSIGATRRFTPRTDGYAILTVTRTTTRALASITTEGITVWADPSSTTKATTLLPVRQGNLAEVRLTGTGSSSAELIWIPFGNGAISLTG
ncbi:hypothetical protein OH799_02715 [Nocardia sp. NBC_00881]|uniref:hypothetical protein n=1 Tax=Nocardia sp. NBC_00881 TaxID=2975995 RepID=UPI003862D3EA|nr:hypothetical protein OH799_02715 [Nocardia sp. NBC_00881]